MSRALRVSKRRPLDQYFTPDDLASALVALLPIEPADTVLEPHAGGGAFVRALLPVASRVFACDIDEGSAAFDVDGVYPLVGDFLERRSIKNEVPRWTIGNPPFRGFEKHVNHALTLSRHTCFLMRLAVMESAKRTALWSRWPLRKVWVLAERPSFTGGGTDSAAYGFFWLDNHHTGPAEVVPGWSWKRAKVEMKAAA